MAISVKPLNPPVDRDVEINVTMLVKESELVEWTERGRVRSVLLDRLDAEVFRPTLDVKTLIENALR